KTFRDTYCQMLIDMDASKLSAVSVTMGHATTRTTEEHYGRMKEVRALQEVKALWTGVNTLRCKKSLIEASYEPSGYA
ncbi:MAG TPA: hypothetical protein VMB46_02285, partial [Methanomassiliicoccales archaeon]|nr:hypothetical protein [Methanomassiliicoccales archaeon]